MPTELKISLDASEYRRELQRVLEESRRMSGELSALKTGYADDVEFAVRADTSDAEKVLSDLSGKTFTVRGTVEAPEIPEAEDQSYTISGTVNAPDVPAVEDQQYTVRGTVDAPEIPHAEDQAFTVTAQTERAEKSLRDLEQQVKRLPAQKNIDINVRQSGNVFRGIWEQMTTLQGGAKQLVAQLLAGGGAIGIAIAGVQGAVKAVTAVYDLWTQKARDAAEIGDRNAESLREAGRAQEELKQKTDAAGGKLQELASQEKLSNAAKAEAVNLINDLSQGYGNLGVTIDSVTGKISGLDAALIKKAGIDKERQLANLRAQLKQEEANRDLHTRERDDAGFSIPGSRDMRIGGADKVKEEQSKIDASNKNIMEIRKKIREIEKADPENRGREKLKAEVKDLEKQLADDNRRFKRKQADAVYSDSNSSEEQKIGSRNEALKYVHADRVNSELNGQELLKQIATLRQSAANETDPKRREEIEDQILGKRKELAQEQLRYNRLQEQEWDLRQQIKQVADQHKKAVDDMISAAQTESDIAKASLRGEHEKIEALRLEARLKQRNLKLSEQEKQAILDQKKQLGSLKLSGSMQDRAFDLYGKIMEQAGRGVEYAKLRALNDAQKLKGSKLTEDEAKKTIDLAAISYRMSQGNGMPNIGIQTNDLTARGGFQTGAYVPELKDRYQADQLKEMKSIKDLIKNVNSSLQEYLK